MRDAAFLMLERDVDQNGNPWRYAMGQLFSDLAYMSFLTVSFAIVRLIQNAFRHESTPAVACAQGALLGLAVSLTVLYIARPVIKLIKKSLEDEMSPKSD